MFLKILNRNNYKPLTIQDKRLFIATLNAVQRLALSMIANGVIVLPNDRRKNVKKTHLLHYFMTKNIKQQKEDKTKRIGSYLYQDVMTTKQVILACIEKGKREYFDALINSVIVIKGDNDNSKSSKILLSLNKQIFKKLKKEAKIKCINDIVFMEKNINTINNRFKQHLPKAKKAGKILLSKMNFKINTVPKNIKVLAK